MSVIEESYVIYDLAEIGGEVGSVVMRYDLARGEQGPREWILDTLSGEPLKPGTYALDFIQRDYIRTGRSAPRPSFETVTAGQGHPANRRPALRIITADTTPEGRQ